MCIDRLFEGIYKNFNICSMTLEDFKVGQYIPHLQVNVLDDAAINLYKCKVVYSNNGKIVLKCTDGTVPVFICVKDDRVIKVVAVHLTPVDDYEELFESEQ